MIAGRVSILLIAGMFIAMLSGCSNIQGGLQNLFPTNLFPVKKTVGRAMVREAVAKGDVPLEIYARPGAGGVGPDGKLVIASNVKMKSNHKKPVDSCGNVITPGFNGAELNDDQRTLSNLLATQERQLRTARSSVYSANDPSLKDVARQMVRLDKQEIEQLKMLRKQLCKESRQMAANYSAHHHTR